MTDIHRPDREQLHPTAFAERGGVRGDEAGDRPFAHDFAVIRARADEWRARSEQTVALADGGEGMGV